MIVVDNLSVFVGSFGLRSVSLTLPDGEYGVLMGKTGTGKTTLLEAICGLRAIAGGSIRLNDREVTTEKVAGRGIGYVPQDRALFSTMTVHDHLAFALIVRRRPADVIARRVGELAALLGIEPLLRRRPRGLSGGEAQRVALGRALAADPRVLLLDEPLGALDDETRDQMCRLLESIQERTGVTILHVTHSLSEARRLADKLFILKDGVIREANLDGTENNDGDRTEIMTTKPERSS
jgi:ABC-type sugar transport system ATPase subunit